MALNCAFCKYYVYVNEGDKHLWCKIDVNIILGQCPWIVGKYSNKVSKKVSKKVKKLNYIEKRLDAI